MGLHDGSTVLLMTKLQTEGALILKAFAHKAKLRRLADIILGAARIEGLHLTMSHRTIRLMD